MNKPHRNNLQAYSLPPSTGRVDGEPAGAYIHVGGRKWVREVARGMLALLLAQTVMLAVPAQAQITASQGAPSGQKPIMDAAQNGVPIVHIAPPSAGGVSRNQYNQFNVNTNGAILNNSASPVLTQQGGWISGNMQLGPTPARIILNEVVGPNASQLRGTIEVAGQRADIVVANPNGITCDGCGFLNTGRASLSTGAPQFNSDGSLRGFDVRQGQLTVGGNGLNAANLEQLDLIARGIVIEGEVWAKNLNVLAGANQVLYGTLQNTVQSGSGAAPQFAVDIKDLGGMYANQIYLVSTEQGLGVNSTGRMAALQGNLSLSANGDLTLQDSYAKQNIQAISTGNIRLTGQTQSDGEISLAAAGSLSNQGVMDANAQLDVNAAALANSGTIAQRGAQNDAVFATGAITNTGTVYSAGGLRVNAGSASVDNTGGTLLAEGAVRIDSGNLVNHGGSIASYGQNDGALTLNAADIDNRQGSIDAARQLAVSATGAIDNTQGALQSGTDTAAAAGTGSATITSASLDNTGGRLAVRDDLNLITNSLNNYAGTVSAGQTAAVQLGSGLLDNTQGQLIGSQALTLQSGEIRNSAGTIASGSALALDTQGAALTNDGGQIVASGNLTIASARFDNTGGVAASINGNLQADTHGQQLLNDNGKLQAAGNVTVTAGDLSSQSGLVSGLDVAVTAGTLNNDSGQMIAGGNLALGTQALSNAGGLLQAAGNAQIDTHGQALTNTGSGNAGGIVAGGTLNVAAGSIDNQAGFIASTGTQTLTVTGDLDNRAANGEAGVIVTNGDSTITAANVLNQGGRINALGNAGITTGLLDNRGGALAANGTLQLAATTLDNRAQNGVAGTIDATDISITATSMNNGGGIVRSGNDTTLHANAVDNAGGDINAARYLGLTSVDLANSGGTLVGDSAVTITTSSQSPGGTIASANDVTLNVNGDYSNTGLLSSQRNLTLNATNISNSGTLTAGETLAANTGNLTNSGEISGHDVQLNVTGTLANADSGLIDGINTNVNAGIINNTGRIYGDLLRVSAGTVNNSGSGVIAARDTLLLGAQNLNNTGGGLIYSLNDIGIGGAIDGNGQLQGSVQNLLNASSKIEASHNLALAATTLVNRNDGLTTHQVVVGTGYQEEIQSTSNATRYPSGLCSGIGGGQDDNSCIVHPDVYGQRAALQPARTETCIDYGESNIVCNTQINYAWNSPVFAQFQVAAVSAPPSEPSGVGGCTTYYGDSGPGPVNSTECNQWYIDYANWSTAFNAAVDQLEVKLNAYNAEVNEDNRLDHFEDYTWFKLNSTTTHTEVATTAPGQILSGGTMTLTGAVTNQQSNIVAGGALTVVGPTVDNVASHGEERTDYSGTTQFTHVDSCGTFGGSHCRHWEGVNPYNPAPVIITTDLANVVYEQNAGNTTTVRNLAVATTGADATTAAGATQAGGNTHVPVVSVTANVGDAGNVILSTPPVLAVPTSNLFAVHAEPSAHYLVETDPRFTSQHSFLSSDYFQQALQRDPERQLKRYGDGFTEQQLVNDQVLALTGRRFLSDYTSTEAEYKSLMDAGVAFTQKYRLTPGVALSAEQMALLTTDVVLLTTRSVTLADGSTQDVYVPQVYLRRPAEGDLQPSGALMAGTDVVIQTAGKLANSGTIAGDTVTAVAGNDLVNQGRIGGQDILLRANNDLQNLSGVITGTGANSNISLLAGRDIVLQTQTLASVNNDGSSTRSSVQHIATVQGNAVQLAAGRDLVANGATVNAAGDLTATAAHDIRIGTAAGQYHLRVDDASGHSTQGRTAYLEEASTTNQSATFSSGGNTVLAAAGDAHLTGAQIAGDTVQIQAQNVTIDAAADRTMADLQTVQRKAYNRALRDDETLVASNINAGNNATIRAAGNGSAGSGDLTLTAANVNADKGQAALVANNDIAIGAGSTKHIAIDESYSKSSSLFSSVATTKANSTSVTRAEGSAITGDTIVAQAGHDLAVQGSAVVGDNNVSLDAANNLGIVAATSTRTDKQYNRVEENGFLSGGGGFGISYGKRVTTTTMDADGTTQSGQERSQVGSLNGDLAASAGKNVHVSGSDVSAGHDLALAGQSVTIDPGVDTSSSKTVTKMEQDALTLKVGGSVVEAIQTLQQMGDAAGKTKNKRMQALAAATAAMAAKNAAANIAKKGVSVNISLTAGHSESEQTQTHADSIHSGSTVAAGNNVDIRAIGAGKDSNLDVIGSDLSAGNNVTLTADNRIHLQAAQDLEAQHSQSKSMSVAAGIAAEVGTKGTAFGFTASASMGRAHEDGDGVTQVNTHVNAGNVLALQSGGDTDIKGAVAGGRQVIADVGGNLNIESLQDTAKFDSKSQNLGGSITVGFGASGNIDYSQSQIHNDYASVQEQSGIAAGDNGFQVNVKGNTDLKGGVIAGNQAAIDNNRNSLTTGTLTQSDIHNHADYNADSFGVSAGFSVAGGDGKNGPDGKPETGEGKGIGGTNLINAGDGRNGMGLPGVAADSGSDGSTTRSGISGGAIVITDGTGQQSKTGQDATTTVASINRDVATGKDTSGKIANNFNKEEIQANLSIASAFMQQAAPVVANVVGTIASKQQAQAAAQAAEYRLQESEARKAGNTQQADDYKALADQADTTARNWSDNGISRVALHTAAQSMLGGLAGGKAGALDSGAGVIGGNLGQRLGETLGTAEADKQGLTGDARNKLISSYQQAFATVGGALAGAAAGGGNGNSAIVNAAQGGTTAYNIDTFNRQLHPDEAKKLAQLKQGKSAAEQQRLNDAMCALVHCSAGVPDSDPNKQVLVASENRGNTYKPEQDQIKLAGGFDGYSKLDGANDWLLTHDEGIRRAQGAGNLVSGSIGTVAGLGLTGTSVPPCLATGVGCLATLGGVGLTGLSWKAAVDGNRQFLGPYTSTQGQRVLDSFDPATYPGDQNRSMELGIDATLLTLGLGAGRMAGKLLQGVPLKPISSVVKVEGENSAIDAGTGLKTASGDLNASANSARNQPYGNGGSGSPSPGTNTAGSTGGNIAGTAAKGVTTEIAATGTSTAPTRFVNGVTVVDQKTGQVLQGTVDLQPTFDRIAAGVKFPSRNDGTVFKNYPDRTTGQIALPQQPVGYYKEYVVPTPSVSGPGPQRLVVGQGGEMYYTPDHYTTFIPVKKAP
jgi:filamentous hemagglutinin